MADVMPKPRPITGLRARQLAASHGYDATEDRGRRRPVQVTTYSEDEHANPKKRRTLTATTRDARRNLVLAAWAIRKHITYIADQTFRAKTDDPEFNRALEGFMYKAMLAPNFDVAGRHSFHEALRLAEGCAVTDGDVFWLKLAPPQGSYFRGKIQAIEGDRVAMSAGDMPANSKPGEWVNGVRVGKSGESKAFAICRRSGSRLELERIVGANSILQHGYFDRFDQVRGISPLAAALNQLRDLYETNEYIVAKLKLSQLVGLKIKRASDGQLFGPGTAQPEADADGDGVADSNYKVQIGRGPFMLDLDPGDDADILESKTPSTESIAYMQVVADAAIKSLDLDYSFYDSSSTNFYGSRGAINQYLKSSKPKVARLQRFADGWAEWRIGLAIADGELLLPAGKDFDWIDWEFVHAGVPFWRPDQEYKGAAMAVAGGFSSPQRICREIGTDFETNIREIKEAMKIAQDAEVPLTYADSSAYQPGITVEAGNAN